SHLCFFFSSRRRHTRSKRDWSSDVCSSDLEVKHRAPAFALISRNGCEGFRSTAIDLAKLFAAYLFVFFIGQVTEMPHEAMQAAADRKSTRLNSSHVSISYAVFCLKKKNINN